MTKHEMFFKYKNLVYKAIKDTHCNPRTEDEWQSYYDAGIIGLLKGIQGYDSNRELTTTYFYESIKRGIMYEFCYQSRAVRKINYIENESLDNIEKKNFYEMIADENINIEKDFIKKEEYEDLYEAIDKLKPSYKEIICDYFGIKRPKKTLESMSKESHVSRQAMNAKKDNALKKLKAILLTKRKEEEWNTNIS